MNMRVIHSYTLHLSVWFLIICTNRVIPIEENVDDHDSVLNTNSEDSDALSPPGQSRAGEEGVTVRQYFGTRNKFLMDEAKIMLGGNLKWESETEKDVNEILMEFKRREYREGLDGTNGRHFPGAQHFFHAKNQIEISNVFKIIRLLPKGAALHMHDFTTGSVEFVALNITYWPNLYLCFQPSRDYHLTFLFSDVTPTTPCTLDGTYDWTLVSDYRQKASSFKFVDDLFIKSMTLFTDTPELDYRDNNGVWYHFGRKIGTVSGVVGYVEALKVYYYQTLQEFHDDNVMYIENRGLLEYVYRLDQTELTPAETLAVYKEVTEEFKKNNPGFWGAKFIITPIRFYPRAKMAEMVKVSIQLKRRFPSFFAGFDIVAHENIGIPNIEYINQLLDAANNGVKFFFHAGETDWHGTKVDDNILDAILLNTTRIGHGTALNGRPYLANIVLNRKIGLEVSPISGQVLRLFEDFRMHPAIPLFRAGSPIVIASDNPGMWKSSGLSYDWYIAFMAMAGARADLRFLKQLALNSINYSAMSRSEKKEALYKWKLSWKVFLGRVLSEYPTQVDFETINLTSKNPMQLFIQWREEAMTVPDNSVVDAMTLATVKQNGSPSARTVLLRGMDDTGYKIYTDYRSPKGQEIAKTPKGALVFLWQFIRSDGMQGNRQVRIEGDIEKVSSEESQRYFDSEPVLAQIRTAVQNQTRTITDNRESMRAEAQALLDKINEDPNYKIQKPPMWGGYLLKPTMMEFYQGVRDNFNDRVRFRKQTADEQNGNYEPGIFPGENGWAYFQVEP